MAPIEEAPDETEQEATHSISNVDVEMDTALETRAPISTLDNPEDCLGMSQQSDEDCPTRIAF